MNKLFTLATAFCVAAGAYAADTVYDLVPQSWQPVDGKTVDYASGGELRFGVTFTDATQRPIDGAKGTLTCEEANYSSDVNITWFEMAQCPLVDIVEEIKADGTYVLEVPQGQWGDADFIAGNGGHANAAFTRTYTVTGLGSGDDEKTCTVVSTDPADGSAIIGFPKGSTLTINTTDNSAVDEYYVYFYDVTGLADKTTGGEYLYQGYGRNMNAADPIVFGINADILEFEKNHEYRVDLLMYSTAYMGPDTKIACQHSLYYTGAADEYIYSPVKQIAIEPNPETYVIESPKGFTCTAIFDGYVNVNLNNSFFIVGQGYTSPLNESQVAYNAEHTEVSITFDEAFLAGRSDATVSLNITDENGLVVNSGDNLKDNSHFRFSYVCEFDLVDVNVNPAQGVVTVIDKISITCDEFDGEMNLSYTALDVPTIQTLHGEVLRTLAEPTVTQTKGEGMEEIKTEYTFTVEPPITEAGTYVFILPKGYFVLGNQFSTGRSAAAYVRYDIEAEEGDITYDFIPTLDGSSIALRSYDASVLDMMLKWTDEAYSNYEILNKCVVKDADGNNIQEGLSDFAVDFNDYTLMGLALDAALYEDGSEYILSIPKGLFGNSEWDQAMYTTGRANPALEIKFTTAKIISIDTTTSVESSIIDAVAVNNDVYNMQGVLVLRNATIEQVRQLPAGLYIFGGKKVAVK